MTKKFIILFVAAAVLFIGGDLSVAADATVVPGKIVVNHDEYTLGDFWDYAGFYYLPDDTSAFALNVASWFMDGGKGNFLVYSQDWGLTGTDLEDTMISAGHTWTILEADEFPPLIPDQELLVQQYDAIFVAGPSKPDNNVLIDYVESGGHVYLAGGTGDFGYDAAAEAAAWNGFLNYFNLNFHPVGLELNDYNKVCCILPVTPTHPIFTEVTEVKELFYNNGNSVSELDSDNPNTDILTFDLSQSHGLIGVFDVDIAVSIDIKPGSDPNSINLSSAGVIPVAILSTLDFDAPEEVDPVTVSLAGAEIKVAGKSGKYLSHEEDVNDDGLLDLVCQVLITEDWAIELGETSAVLEALTYDGQSIRGKDTIRIVPDN